MLQEILNTSDGISIAGINGNGLNISQKGRFDLFGEVWFSNKLNVNLLSHSALVDAGYVVCYRDGQDYYTVQPPGSDDTFIFRREKGSGFYSTIFNEWKPWSRWARK